MKSYLSPEYHDPVKSVRRVVTAVVCIVLFIMAGKIRFAEDAISQNVYISNYICISIIPFLIIMFNNIKCLHDVLIVKILYFIMLPKGILFTRSLTKGKKENADNSIILEFVSWMIIIIVPIIFMMVMK